MSRYAVSLRMAESVIVQKGHNLSSIRLGAVHISCSKCSLSVCVYVSLDVNQSGTECNCSTQTLVIWHAQTY